MVKAVKMALGEFLGADNHGPAAGLPTGPRDRSEGDDTGYRRGPRRNYDDREPSRSEQTDSWRGQGTRAGDSRSEREPRRYEDSEAVGNWRAAGPPRGDEYSDRYGNRDGHRRDDNPVERPASMRLNLQKRSVEKPASASATTPTKSNPFGGARPVDTDSKTWKAGDAPSERTTSEVKKDAGPVSDKWEKIFPGDDRRRSRFGGERGMDRRDERSFDRRGERPFDRRDDRGFDRRDDRGFDRRDDRGFDRGDDRGFDRRDERGFDRRDERGFDRRDDRGFDRRDDRGFDRRDDRGFDRRDDRGFDRRDDRGFDRRDDRGFDRRDDRGYDRRNIGSRYGGRDERGYGPRFGREERPDSQVDRLQENTRSLSLRNREVEPSAEDKAREEERKRREIEEKEREEKEAERKRQEKERVEKEAAEKAEKLRQEKEKAEKEAAKKAEIERQEKEKARVQLDKEISAAKKIVASGKKGDSLKEWAIKEVFPTTKPCGSVLLKEILENTPSAKTSHEWTQLKEYGSILAHVLYEAPVAEQLKSLYVFQKFWFESGKVKKLAESVFIALYQNDILVEDAFISWKHDLNDSVPGKMTCLFDTTAWLTWLETAASEDEEDEEEED